MKKATILFALILFAASGAACATSRVGEAAVLDDSGVPCFTITKSEEHRAGVPSLVALAVDDTTSKPLARTWSFIRKLSVKPLPIASDSCIRYGAVPDGMEAIKSAEPLQAGRIYSVYLNASPADDTDPTFGYNAKFCLSAQADGTMRVHQIDTGNLSPEACKP